jgi:uncharacterized protein DUF420
LNLPSGTEIILTLKMLVAAVTVLLIASLIALRLGRPRLHGQINTVFFALTLLTVIGFEVVLQFVDVSAAFDDETRRALRVHLGFAVPAAVLVPFMLFTGKTGRRSTHIACAAVFGIMWAGTVVTGIFFLPHTSP